MMGRASLAIVASTLVLAAAPRAAGTRFIAETDLLRFTWIADPQISPDGSMVAFVRVTVNEKDNRYETSLFVVDTIDTAPPGASMSPGRGERVEGRRLTANTRDTAPRWSPDGKSLAFVRAVEKDGKQEPGQLYLLSMDGGEARPLTDLPHGVGAPVWSPDGRTLAFSAPVDDVPGRD